MPTILLNTIALDPNRWTADKTPYTVLADVLPPVVAAGFSSLEVWQYHLSTLDEAGVDALIRRADDLGVTVPIVGIYPALHLHGAARDQEWDMLKTTLERAQRIGAGTVKMFAGRLGTAEASRDDVERSVAFTRQLATLAADHAMTLVAETHPDTLCDSVEATRRFLDAVGDDRMRICFQPYDFTRTDQTLSDYHALRERIVHIHLQGRRNDEMSLLEEADINYDDVLTMVARDGFDGALSIEFVKGCVVRFPGIFDLDLVLANAQRDRAFVESILERVPL